MGLDHFRICNSGGLLEFGHYAGTYPKGWWRKENGIVLDHCKMNVFVSGEFSLFCGNSLYEPTHGDAFLAEPAELHCGNISKENFIEYYQLDFDEKLFENIPHGREFYRKLISAKRSVGAFLNTEKHQGEDLIRLCESVEAATEQACRILALTRCVELLYAMFNSYSVAKKAESVGFSHTVSEAIRFADEYSGGKLCVADIAKRCLVSESYLLRCFKAELGETPSGYFMRKRLSVSVSALTDGCNISDVAAQFGFSDASHYIACFKRCFGCTPKEYKNSRQRRDT